MKIAVTATGGTLEDQVSPQFGRAPWFLIVDTETLACTATENPNLALGHGAGIQSAQYVADSGVGAVLTGNCGPNAQRTLEAAGITVYSGTSGVIREAIARFSAGELTAKSAPTVGSHFGAGGGGGGRGMGQGGRGGGAGGRGGGGLR